MKKITALFLAMLMAMALAVPAFAEGEEGEEEAASNEKEMEVTTTVKVPNIDVDVPTTGTIFINPMGFTVKLADGANATVEEANADASENVTTSEQIVSPISFITNKSAMKLDVKAYAYAVVGTSGVTISDEAITESETENKARVYAQFETIAADNKETTKKLTRKDYAAPTDGKGDTLLVGAAAPEGDPTYQIVGTMKPATGTTEYEYTYLGFQFFGDVVQEPENDWEDGASFKVHMVFNFAVNTDA